MLKHIVLFKFAITASERQIEQALAKLGNLKNTTIPQIKSFSFGKNCSPENLNKGFSYAFVMEFLSEEDREGYLKHHDHIRVASDDIMPLTEDGINSVIVLDYKF
ncbi:stress responsive A/B Barrel domain protein [Rickettsia endosymbiont of Ixodes pacificus]|uniref:Dabb family protein n=1 Tax=Rickettsia endosymbiont of Ixodes pacificus TaxID=1133329 RepID=UPI0005F7E82A|nr:Dabb family protein [Rickettsia endosymbiont of Ixodes pacificus]KJW02853.1 stress responsive A/B Barrel domain protein [Rickettsia endosymbiont of Ixodes pacificus]